MQTQLGWRILFICFDQLELYVRSSWQYALARYSPDTKKSLTAGDVLAVCSHCPRPRALWCAETFTMAIVFATCSPHFLDEVTPKSPMGQCAAGGRTTVSAAHLSTDATSRSYSSFSDESSDGRVSEWAT